MSDEMKTEKETAAAWFRTLRDEIIASFEALENTQTYGRTADMPVGRFDVSETSRTADDGGDAG